MDPISVMAIISLFSVAMLVGIGIGHFVTVRDMTQSPTLEETQATLANIKENLDRIGVNLKEFDNK